MDTILGDRNDTYFSGAGNDRVHGGGGNDSIYGGDGRDTLYGDDGNDFMGDHSPERWANLYYGGNGKDTVYIADGHQGDMADGGNGRDKIMLYFSAATKVGVSLTFSAEFRVNRTGDALDEGAIVRNFEVLDFLGTRFADSVSGGNGNDTLRVVEGDDSVFGGAGDDALGVGLGHFLADGGEGRDILTLDLADFDSAVTWSTSAASQLTMAGYEATATQFEQIDLTSGSGDDSLSGGDLGDRFSAGMGANLVSGGGGNDTIYGGLDAETLFGGSGDDILYRQGFFLTTAGAELYGGEGDDTVAGGRAFDTLYGGIGDDILTVRSTTVHAFGGEGNDTFLVYGGGTIDAGAGDDRVIISYIDMAADVIGGGVGRDVLEISSKGFRSSTSMQFTEVEGGHQLQIDGYVTEVFTGFERFEITGGRGGDFLTGGKLGDVLVGGKNTAGSDADTLSGFGGADVLSGLGGDDDLTGGDGDDTLYGGYGADEMKGGNGNDVFRYSSSSYSTITASDLIVDFVQGTDKIDLEYVYVPGTDNSFRFLGTGPFDNQAGALIYGFENGTTVITAYTYSDATVDMRIVLTGEIVLTADDFVL